MSAGVKWGCHPAGLERSKPFAKGAKSFRVTIGSGSDAASGYVGQAGATAKIRCPSCGDGHPRRLERKGFLEKRVYPLFGYFPWFCASCKSTFLMRKRYRRKAKMKEYAE